MADNSPSSDQPADLLRSLPSRALLMFQQDFDWRITGRWMIYSVLVGIAGALAALLFANLLSLTSHFALTQLVGYPLPSPGGEASPSEVFNLNAALTPTRRWLLFFVPAAGGLVAGWLVFTFAPETEGSGMDSVIKAFHHEEGRTRARVPLVKMLASTVTIGTGGSAGREGPIAHIGSSLGSLLAERLGLSVRERRILLVAGIAAGVGSIFRSPLGGAFFAVEVLYQEELETEALMQAVVASITGYSIYSSLEKSSSLFTTPEFSLINPPELLLVAAFALGCILIGFLYVKVLHHTREHLFARLPIPTALKPGLGGLFVGGLAFFFPAVLGSSYGWLQQAINGNLPLAIMAGLAVTKILATSFTIGSGGSGGVFAPSLVIGGMLGGLFSESMQMLSPELVIEPGAYVMIGMATFFAGVANVPLSATIMISELTGRYTLLVPLIFAAVVVHVISENWSIYEEQLPTHRDSPAHRAQLITRLLNKVRVENVIDYPVHFHTLTPDHTLEEMLSVFTRTQEVVLPVVQNTNEEPPPSYSGLVLLEDVQSLLQSSDTMQHLIVAYDVKVPFAAVHLHDTLDQVLEIFVETQYPELPVLDDEEKIVGFVRQSQVINEYHRTRLREEVEAA